MTSEKLSREQLLQKHRPSYFPVCMVEECGIREQCLRAMIFEDNIEKEEVFPLINPARVMPEEGVKCPWYQSSEPVLFAIGFAQALNSLSKVNYEQCTQYLINKYSKSTFYRWKNGEVALSPELQQMVAEALHAFGYPEGEVQFDAYEYRMEWA